MVDQAKAAFQNLKKCFDKKNELKKSNNSQVNHKFTRRIKSYLKKDSLPASFIFCIKLLNTPFSSRLRNNSCTHIFLFLLFSVESTNDRKIKITRRQSYRRLMHLGRKKLMHLGRNITYECLQIQCSIKF